MISQSSPTPTINLVLTDGYQLQKRRFSDNRWLRLKPSTNRATKPIKITVFDHLRLVLRGMESPQGTLTMKRTSLRSATCSNEEHVSPSVSISHRTGSSRYIGNRSNRTVSMTGKITNVFLMFQSRSLKKCSCPFYLELAGFISIMTINQKFLFSLQD
jgi:hypothetical protein